LLFRSALRFFMASESFFWPATEIPPLFFGLPAIATAVLVLVNKKSRISMVRLSDHQIRTKCAGLSIGSVLSKTSIAGCPSFNGAEGEPPFLLFRIAHVVI